MIAIIGSRPGTGKGCLSLSSMLSLNHAALGGFLFVQGGQVASKTTWVGDEIFLSLLPSDPHVPELPLTASVGTDCNRVTRRWLEMITFLSFLVLK